MGFSAADAVTGLKLVEEGVPKAQLALLAVPMVPLQILLPVVISKYTAGPRPLDVFYKAFPFRSERRHKLIDVFIFSELNWWRRVLVGRLLIGLEYALLVWWTPSVKQEGGFPVYYYAIVLLSYALHQVGYLTAVYLLVSGADHQQHKSQTAFTLCPVDSLVLTVWVFLKHKNCFFSLI